jgi:hypothetical protein
MKHTSRFLTHASVIAISVIAARRFAPTIEIRQIAIS